MAPAVAETLNRTGTAQCGACTPGVVMSAHWLCRHPNVASGVDVREYMSGNLCRCTGYDGSFTSTRKFFLDNASRTMVKRFEC